MRQFNIAAALLLLTTSLSGCVGFDMRKPSVPEEVALEKASLVVPKDEVVGSLGIETRIYDHERRWCGLTIWMVIPIPLWLPVCEAFTEVTFENGKPTKVKEQNSKTEGFLCGPFVPLIGLSNQPMPVSFCGHYGH